MAVFLLDLLFRMFTWGIVALGLLLALHALFTDHFKGLLNAHKSRRALATPRLRCPGGFHRALRFLPLRQGCWYDMSGATPDPGDHAARLLCPECGRRSSPKRLRRSKRRYRLALLGLAIILLGLAARYSRDLYQNGWKSVPDAALVLVPFDERDWLENDLPNAHWIIKAATVEINDRSTEGSLSPWASAHLGHRIQRRYQRDPDYGIDDASRAAFAKLESTPFTTGIDNRPFSEAVATIAAAASVQLTLNRAALEAAHIQPDRRITIPAFNSMTCEMALDWACDRARAMSGWAVGEWTLDAGRLIVADDATTDATQRVLVVLAPSAQPDWTTEFLGALVNSAPDRWLTRGSIRRVWGAGDAAGATTNPADLLRMDRLARTVKEPLPFDPARASAINALRERLESARITPIQAHGTLELLIHGLRAEARASVSMDPWGLEPYQTLTDALIARGVLRSDRTRHDADPFGNDRDNPDAEPIDLAWQGLWAFGTDAAHDDSSIVIGLRATQLLAVAAAYDLSTLAPGEDPRNPRAELQTRIFGERSTRNLGWGRESLVGDRILIIGPPSLQARASEVIQRFLAEQHD